MKTLKLVCMAMLCMAVSLVSCSGEDGETGPQGPIGPAGVAGADGTDGMDGADGTNGADGISCWDLNGNGTGDADEDVNNDGNFDALDCQGVDGVDGADGANGADGADGADGNANVQEHIFDITGEADYTSLSFDLKTIVDNPSNYAFLYYIENAQGLKYSIPGSLRLNLYYTRVWLTPTGFLNIRFHATSDNSDYLVTAGEELDKVIVVAIELTNANKNSENIMAELKAAGVDTSDYNQVAAYFGLE